ncbi:hypothetical protein STEG23_031095 [Scotinomys teguina]
MIHSVNYDADIAMGHELLRQSMLDIRVKIMLLWDPRGQIDPKKTLPDHVRIVNPKHEILHTTLISEQNGGKPAPPAMHQPVTRT